MEDTITGELEEIVEKLQDDVYGEKDRMEDIKRNPSPFKIYEDKYCSTCGDYKGCLGLIDSMTMDLQDSEVKSGNASFDNLVKSMGGLTFTTRFKIILDCMGLRNFIYHSK